MNAEDKTKKLIEESKITTDTQTEKRILGDAFEHLDKLKQQKSPSSGPYIWRIIMRRRVLKYAAAAAIAIVLLSFDPFGITNSGSVAWAKVAQRVEQIETFMFGLTIEVSDPNSQDTTGQITAKWVIYLSEEYGFRMDMGTDEDLVSWYVAPDINEMIMVAPDEKEFIKWPLPADMHDKMPEEYRDPREYISRFMSRPYKKLGRSVIEGVQVEGIEVKDPPTNGESLESAVGQLWVDTETELPIQIKIKGKAQGKTVQWTMDFRWAEALNPDLFDPNSPTNK